jgi:hypothetical protein
MASPWAKAVEDSGCGGGSHLDREEERACHHAVNDFQY